MLYQTQHMVFAGYEITRLKKEALEIKSHIFYIPHPTQSPLSFSKALKKNY